jgi:hypothetical protein
MQKSAGSMDPLQQKLRDSKKALNPKISKFIDNLIHYKKLMNGWPNKFHMEKSFITQEIPADPNTIVGSLANDFQEIAKECAKITQQQKDYSIVRKKKKTQTNPNQLSLSGIASLEDKYELFAEASNPVSRTLTRLFNPGIGFGEAADKRRHRLTLLSACVKARKQLNNLQVEIVRKSNDSIKLSDKIFHLVYNDFIDAYNVFNNYKKNKSQFATEKNKKSLEVDETTENKDYLAILRMADKALLDYKASKSKLKLLINKYPKTNDNLIEFLHVAERFIVDSSVSSANELVSLYNNLLVFLSIECGEHLDSVNQLANKIALELSNKKVDKTTAPQGIEVGKSEKDVDALSSKALIDQKKIATAQVEVLAQKFLKKWVGKLNHKLSLWDMTSAQRLDIYDKADECRDILNAIMDSLEKGLDIEELDRLFKECNSKIGSIKKLLRSLNHYINPKLNPVSDLDYFDIQ